MHPHCSHTRKYDILHGVIIGTNMSRLIVYIGVGDISVTVATQLPYVVGCFPTMLVCEFPFPSTSSCSRRPAAVVRHRKVTR